MNILEKIKEEGFQFYLSIDCEGPNFDKNLIKNINNMEKFLKLCTLNNIYTILFITPKFAKTLYELNLVDTIKKYKVIFGLHIHPEDLPDKIIEKCPFINPKIELISDYPFEEQKQIILNCIDYLTEHGISPIEAYRGGYFSMNDDTQRVLKNYTNIKWESHNIYRKQYNVTKHLIESIPVYAKSNTYELRLEYFDIETLKDMLINAIKNKDKVVAITHSYLFDENDFHYKRDNIKEPIYFRLQKLIDVIKSLG
ncbi:hypothetical protein SAMN05660865_00164 [Caloramator fervidus]|uniref:Polysaccharide deacetylase n=1 Tax=Caloramator fervidus TaxID=29344 RepID=A0A1H5RQH3_9CLOT|nr:hypothetical protein [Caloramator fervidus]SEF40596.1 hypothetical protein SAMN05660865_00164 [Caloramator fervidus]